MIHKRTYLIFGLCLLSMMVPVTGSIAQGNVNALYTTEQDFLNTQLINPVPTDANNKIEQKLGKKLWVYRNGQVTKYTFGSVYGYYQDSVMYRAWQKRKLFSDYGFYNVLGSSGLTLYSKRSSHHRSNGYTWYYYSTTPTGEVKRLTTRNLERDFSAHPEFIRSVSELLDRQGANARSVEGRLLILTYFTEMVKP
jgi:hypothetical protein